MFENNPKWMDVDYVLFAKRQQIKAIEKILHLLCHKELSSEGRQFLYKMIDDIKFEISLLEEKKVKQNNKQGQ